MRIVTWNVNGLKALAKRKSSVSLQHKVGTLDADILCVQETKLSRSELDRELSLIDAGYDSFFSYCQTRAGYSGVATFVRTSLTSPSPSRPSKLPSSKPPHPTPTGAPPSKRPRRQDGGDQQKHRPLPPPPIAAEEGVTGALHGVHDPSSCNSWGRNGNHEQGRAMGGGAWVHPGGRRVGKNVDVNAAIRGTDTSATVGAGGVDNGAGGAGGGSAAGHSVTCSGRSGTNEANGDGGVEDGATYAGSAGAVSSSGGGNGAGNIRSLGGGGATGGAGDAAGGGGSGGRGSDLVGHYGSLGDLFSLEEMLSLDREGRCVITDHCLFVLFNIYAPCVEPGNVERAEFKFRFFTALQCRLDALISAGRNVVVVGDFNLVPDARLDHCEPDECAERYKHNRTWQLFHARHLSSGGGRFVDIFRLFHPTRTHAYTCWNVASGAKAFNYGTRIDFITAASGDAPLPPPFPEHPPPLLSCQGEAAPLSPRLVLGQTHRRTLRVTLLLP
eukprot:jgi/Mesvir1/27748/Mv07438-RA.1